MIGIIVINYRSEDKTISFVKNEMIKVSSDNAVVIVDNGSTDESFSTLLEAFKGWPYQHVFVVPSKENLGFAKGNNLGAEVAINQFDPDVLLFANNDISLRSDDVVDKMALKLISEPQAGAIGPKVIGLDGKLQSPEPFIPFWKRHVSLYWSNLFMSKKRKAEVFGEDYSEKAAEGWHYRVSGSFFMVKTSDWKACGGMDPRGDDSLGEVEKGGKRGLLLSGSRCGSRTWHYDKEVFRRVPDQDDEVPERMLLLQDLHRHTILAVLCG